MIKYEQVFINVLNHLVLFHFRERILWEADMKVRMGSIVMSHANQHESVPIPLQFKLFRTFLSVTWHRLGKRQQHFPRSYCNVLWICNNLENLDKLHQVASIISCRRNYWPQHVQQNAQTRIYAR